ncbi:uncharacterized protein KQ657_001915 [Scheffersomyces spartinae]|uniref:Kinetochore protein SPC25 n=1 Tax=Scheffersomyces spartinae TaxID=45513 RepID=A0A9P7V6Q9_9ASCO|nr:uncharacterized protein KQ657_001915 [Scheffersomyces spartinae]KAG7192197.1 hypothetical protein KQ657_001915 [Scheffersomyces spartinae]
MTDAVGEFNVEEFQQNIDEFERHFEEWLSDTRRKSQREKKEYVTLITKLKSQERQYVSEIVDFQEKQLRYKDQVRSNVEVLEQQQNKIKQLQDFELQMKQEKERLELQLAQLNDEFNRVSDKIHQRHVDIREQQKKDLTELLKYQAYFGLEVKPVGEETLVFIFTKIDANNSEREFTFEIDISGNTLHINNTNPQIPKDQLLDLENDFATHLDMAKFLPLIRKCFQAIA